MRNQWVSGGSTSRNHVRNWPHRIVPPRLALHISPPFSPKEFGELSKMTGNFFVVPNGSSYVFLDTVFLCFLNGFISNPFVLLECGVYPNGTRITLGNTKRITSGNMQKSHTPRTLHAHFGQHGKQHFGQHGKHHSSYPIT